MHGAAQNSFAVAWTQANVVGKPPSQTSTMSEQLRSFVSDRDGCEIKLFSHLDLLPIPEPLSSVKMVVGVSFSDIVKETTSSSESGGEETKSVQTPTMILDFYMGQNEEAKMQSGWEIFLDGSVDLNNMRFPNNVKNRDAWADTSPLEGDAGVGFIHLFNSLFSGPSLKDIGKFVASRDGRNEKKKKELEMLRGILENCLAAPHVFADNEMLLTTAKFLVVYSLLAPAAFEEIFPDETVPTSKKDKKTEKKEKKKKEKADVQVQLESEMGFQLVSAEKKFQLSAKPDADSAVEETNATITFRAAINKVTRVETRMGFAIVTKHGVSVDKVRVMTVEEGQREIDEIEVNILSDLILQNYQTSVTTSSFFALDDNLTKSEIQSKGVNFNFNIEAAAPGSTLSVDYGCAGGNTYKAALNLSFDRRPGLRKVDVLKHRDGEVYAFGHLVTLLAGMLNVFIFLAFSLLSVF